MSDLKDYFMHKMMQEAAKAGSTKADNLVFPDQKSALEHAVKVTQLKSGDYCVFKHEGQEPTMAVFLESLEGRAGLLYWDPEDGMLTGCAVPWGNIRTVTVAIKDTPDEPADDFLSDLE